MVPSAHAPASHPRCASPFWTGSLRRRFEKRILVATPDLEAREAIFRLQMDKLKGGCAVESHEVAAQTEGYSGADVVSIAKEAAMRPLRRLMHDIELGRVAPEQELVTGPILPEDIAAALKSTKPSTTGQRQKYLAWQAEFGAVMSGV